MSLVAALLFAAALPTIEVVDDGGRVRSTAEWRGTPVILAPMYARCPLSCPLIARQLKKGVAQSSALPSTYRVVMLSFDPRDTPEDLHRFRERQQIPLAWSVVRPVNPADTRRFLDAAGYHYAVTGNFYTHPNAIIALNPRLEPAKLINGTNYDIDLALAAARGKVDWVGRYGGWMLAFLVFVCLLAVVVLMTATNGPPRAASVGR